MAQQNEIVYPSNGIINPDIKTVKTECFDVNMMDELASHDGISLDVKKLLKAYKKKRENGNEIQVVYEYGKTMKSIQKGRLYPQKGLGLQNFPSDVRSALASKYYNDIDMVNSQPVILHQLCEKNGWKCDKLKDYVENRSSHLHTIMEDLDCTRDEAKTLCISVMFGGKPKKTTPFIKELIHELQQVSINIVNAYPDILKACSKEKTPSSSCVAHVCQDIEFKILSYIDDLLKVQDRSMDVYIHDGGLVRKKDGEKEFPKNILRQLEKDISKKFSYNISLMEKPMTHSFEFKKDLIRVGGLISEKEYQSRKESFEEHNFYCKATSAICSIQNNIISHVSMKNASSTFSSYNFQKTKDNNIKTFDFVSEWDKDPTKRTVKKLMFYPDVNHQEEDSYNMFNGLKGAEYNDLITESKEIIECFEILLSQNAGNRVEVITYMRNWFALTVQQPYTIPGVALILVNKIQGTGKDTLAEFFGSKVIGREYYKNIKNVETDLFDTHSTAFEKTLFMKIEEANGSQNRKLSDLIKSSITTPTVTINPKNISPYTTDAFPHIIMTSNNAVPVKIEAHDRRFMISYTASDYVGNRKFWNETYRLLGLPGAGNVIYEYLMGIDLKNFIPQDFPKTEYHEILSQSEIPSEDQYLKQCEPFTDLKSTMLHTEYTIFCSENGIKPKSIIYFTRSLAPLLEQKILTRRLKDGCSLYSKK